MDAERAAREAAYENPRQDVQALVPPGVRRVLDLGCSSGVLGAALKARGEVEVIGVELDPDYARDAAARLDRVVVADVSELAQRPDLDAELGRFDCIIAADVLEHLVDPWSSPHSLVGYHVAQLLSSDAHPKRDLAVMLPPTLVLTAALAALGYRYVELPFLRMKGRRVGAPASASDAVRPAPEPARASISPG